MLILAFESSCDESSVALLDSGVPLGVRTKTQTIHQQYGGVVPELSSRSHLALLDQLCVELLQHANISLTDIDLIAATVGPGLIGSLLVGAGYAQGLACSLGVQFRGVHHVEAHLWSSEIEHGPMPLPALVLLVSGGHTILMVVRGLRDYEVIGSTLDDAMGEAFDKVGKLMGLSFPAGAEVERLAAKGNPDRFSFPVALQDSSFAFSFSGLKTAVLYVTQELGAARVLSCRNDLLAAFQRAAVASVLAKVQKATDRTHPRTLVAAGGVAANRALRDGMEKLGRERGLPFYAPSPSLCADNAVMVGYLAWRLTTRFPAMADESSPRPRWPIDLLASAVSVSANQ